MSGKKPKKKTYVPMPKPPPEMAERYRVMLAVMSGQISVSEGARQLGMERNHFQSLMHRGLQGFIEHASPKPGGRPAKSPREAELEVENEKLRRQNERLQARVETIDRLLVVAGDMLKGRIEPKGRSRRKKSSEPEDNGGEKDEPDGDARVLLQGAREM